MPGCVDSGTGQRRQTARPSPSGPQPPPPQDSAPCNGTSCRFSGADSWPVRYGRCSLRVGGPAPGGNFHGTNPQPLEFNDETVGATLVVARVGNAGSPDNGTGQARPLRSLFPARRRPGPRGRNSHGTNPQLFECRDDSVGATLVVARARHAPVAWTAGRDNAARRLVPRRPAPAPTAPGLRAL